MPFGVELPENLGQPTTSTADSGGGAPAGAAPASAAPSGAAPQGSAPQVSTSPQGTQNQVGTPAPPTLTDLDKLERFVFKGREMTRKEFEDGWLRHQDYTRKTQEVSEQRKFAENFIFDLRTVKADRTKMAEFEKLYPKHYVDMAKEYLSQLELGGQHEPQASNPKSSLKEDPEFQAMRSEFSDWKKSQQEAELKSIQSWIDNQFDTLSKKYPFANPEVVNNRAWAASNQGHKIDEAALDKLFKAHDEEQKKKWDEMYKDKIQQQLKAGKEAKDVGSGGDISGGPPKGRPKTMKEAKEQWLADIAAAKG